MPRARHGPDMDSQGPRCSSPAAPAVQRVKHRTGTALMLETAPQNTSHSAPRALRMPGMASALQAFPSQASSATAQPPFPHAPRPRHPGHQ